MKHNEHLNTYSTWNVYEVSVSAKPLPGHRYRTCFGMSIDSEFRDVGRPLCDLLIDHGFSYVSVHEPRTIHDRSWEMAAAIAAIRGQPVFASGVVSSYENGNVTFGSVDGLDEKVGSYRGMQLITA